MVSILADPRPQAKVCNRARFAVPSRSRPPEQLKRHSSFFIAQDGTLGAEKRSLRFTEGVLAGPSVEVPDGSTARGGAPRPEINCGAALILCAVPIERFFASLPTKLEAQVHFCATPLVLIAENDPLVTACYEDIITDASASVCGSFRSCAEAEEWLSDHYPDAAIVGITLQDGSSVPLAKALCGRNIPFLVASRFSANSEGIDLIFKSVKWLKKPFTPFELQAALRALLVAKRDS